MSWSIGYDDKWQRDVGYGVPATCDHPGCNERIDRGLSYVCGGEPFGGEHGCGLHFCGKHLWHRHPRGEDRIYQNCRRCMTYKLPYKPKPDVAEWVDWKLTDESWQRWREEHPDIVTALRASDNSRTPWALHHFEILAGRFTFTTNLPIMLKSHRDSRAKADDAGRAEEAQAGVWCNPRLPRA